MARKPRELVVGYAPNVNGQAFDIGGQRWVEFCGVMLGPKDADMLATVIEDAALSVKAGKWLRQSADWLREGREQQDRKK